MTIIRFLFLCTLKSLGHIFYRFELSWVGKSNIRSYDDIHLGILLNHTSLMDPMFLTMWPLSFLWRICNHGVFPAADITMNRSFAGSMYRALVPHPMSISRRRDHTWRNFLEKISGKAVVFMTPEGRMKRPSGLDKHGQKMSVRSGIVDVLESLNDGNMLIMYSEGLHHVFSPGQTFPKLFKRIRVRFEMVPISEYKTSLYAGTDGFRKRVVADLEQRRDKNSSWENIPTPSPLDANLA